MPVTFDTDGWRQVDQGTWLDDRTGDAVLVRPVGLVPDLPPFLHDPPRMLRQLAIDTATASACVLVEADVIHVDSLPAIYQLVKTPLLNRPTGFGYIASVIIPRAHCSVALSMQAVAGEHTGAREAMVSAEIIQAVGPDGLMERLKRPHPYAADVPHVRYDESDDPRWDARFPDHPLTRARAWVRRTLGTVRLDPRFACLPPFPAPQGVTVPQPPPPPSVTGQLGGGPVDVLPGVPVGDLICLSHSDGGSSFWRMTDPTVALARLGVGEADRFDPTGHGAREVAVLNPTARTLSLGDRVRAVGDGVTGVIPVNADDALNQDDDEGIRSAFAMIVDRSIRAAIRGEALVVGPDGWHPPPTPHFLLTPRLRDEEYDAYLRVTPIPVFAPVWRGHHIAGDSQVFAAPGIKPGAGSGMAEAINLALSATRTWGTHPLRLAMSFVPHPDAASRPGAVSCL
jgi:hypothetical protein